MADQDSVRQKDNICQCFLDNLQTGGSRGHLCQPTSKYGKTMEAGMKARVYTPSRVSDMEYLNLAPLR